MPQFMLIYHGGKRPETEADIKRSMDAWGSWMGTHGPKLADPGNPVGQSWTVSASGTVDNGGANPVSGYTIVNADSIAEACEMASSNPIVADGGSVEVAEIVPIEM